MVCICLVWTLGFYFGMRGGGSVPLKEMYSKWVTRIVSGERRIVGKVSMKTREVIRSNSLENSGDSNILMATAINHSVIPLQSPSDCLACPGVLDSFKVDGWRGYTGVVRKPPLVVRLSADFGRSIGQLGEPAADKATDK